MKEKRMTDYVKNNSILKLKISNLSIKKLQQWSKTFYKTLWQIFASLLLLFLWEKWTVFLKKFEVWTILHHLFCLKRFRKNIFFLNFYVFYHIFWKISTKYFCYYHKIIFVLIKYKLYWQIFYFITVNFFMNNWKIRSWK